MTDRSSIARRVLLFGDTHSKSIAALAALMVPLVVAVAGWFVNDTVSRREVSAQYLSVALTILGPGGDADAELDAQERALREYAVDLLSHASPVALDDDLQRSLVDGSVDLPEFGALDAFSPNAQRAIELLNAGTPVTDCRWTTSTIRFSIDAPALPAGTHDVSAIRRFPSDDTVVVTVGGVQYSASTGDLSGDC